MLVRSNLYTSPGGDTTQIDMTAKYLRQLGVTIDIALSNSKLDLKQYELIHFFNIIRPDDILPFIHYNIPFVVSTIFVDYSEYEKKNRTGIFGLFFRLLTTGQIEYVKAIARWIKNGDRIKSRYYLFNGHLRSIKRVAIKASLLLPNSNSEYIRLSKYLDLYPNYKKIVNAVDQTVFNKNVSANENYRNHVLCVGRIEGRKSQLNLIKALLNTDLKLTIIGKPSPNHISYYKACKDLAATSKNIYFLEHVSHFELAGIYKAAKVHVLASWFETTGLSTLEAGAMGCNIVITKNGDTEEYFKKMAYYCNPNDIKSIRNVVKKAYDSEINKDLKNYILENYTWDKTAQQTLNAYKEVLAVKKKN